MNKMFGYSIAFCLGCLIGGGVSYKLLKSKFEERVDYEIKSIKNLYEKKHTANKKVDDDTTEYSNDNNSIKESEIESNSIISKEKREYVKYAEYYKSSNNTTNSSKKPYIISPDEFNSDDEYETIWLTLYADGVLADERDNKIDIESTIGVSNLNGFGEYENDVVYIRNDEKKCDFEISRDPRTFKEVVGDDNDEE